MIGSFLRRLRPKPRLGHLIFTVYSREQCSCCHQALDLLKSRQPRHGFAIEVIDVDSDPALAEAYGLSVPVVTLNGKVRFKEQVNPALLDRLLAAESQATRNIDSCSDCPS